MEDRPNTSPEVLRYLLPPSSLTLSMEGRQTNRINVKNTSRIHYTHLNPFQLFYANKSDNSVQWLPRQPLDLKFGG